MKAKTKKCIKGKVQILDQFQKEQLTYILLAMIAVAGFSCGHKGTMPEVSRISPIDPLATTECNMASLGSPSPVSNPDISLFPEDPVPISNQSICVEVILIERSWMRVIVDDQIEFEGILQQGDTRVWRADEKLIIRVGNAGGVLVAYNNQEAEKMGEAGHVAEITFLSSDHIP